MSIHDLHIILKQTSKHFMLSCFSSLSLSSIRSTEEEADTIYVRIDPLIKLSLLYKVTHSMFFDHILIKNLKIKGIL